MTYWVGTSWKMNKTLDEGLAFSRDLAAGLDDLNVEIQPFVVPPFTIARQVADQLAATRVRVGAQNMHWSDNGAWTGEISPPMLTDCGLSLVELGHSERREHFGETDLTVGRKTEAAIRHGLVPLICVGETLAEREAGHADEVLIRQVTEALVGLDDDQRQAPMLFAYEPVWAIGEHGIPASASYASERHGVIGQTLIDQLPDADTTPPVLYGGSVNESNTIELLTQPHVDGLFIGRAAWNVEGYLNILQLAGVAVAGK